MIRTVLLSFLLVLLAGCTKLGPDFTPPKAPKLPQELQKNNKESAKELAMWWRVFDDATLNALITQATSQNLDIQAASLRILQSRTLLGLADGLQYPQVQNLSGSYTTTYRGGFHDMTTLGFDIGWEMDIWGKYARGIESAQANLYTSIANYHDIMVSVIAEVARNYIIYQTTQERIEYAKRNIAIQERIVKLTELQYHSGNVSELDMQQARTQLYNTQASLPSLELAKIKAVNALAVLLGTTSDKISAMLQTGTNANRPHQFATYLQTTQKGAIQLLDDTKQLTALGYIPLPHIDPYKKIDAALLMQRPDIKAAEYRAHAASAKIGKAQAKLYPSFTLFGTIGINSPSILGENLSVSAGPAFSWDIFHYDRLKNQVRFADARFEESLVKYSKKVLQATRDVSDALHAYISAKEQLQERQKALEATVRAFNISVRQYQDGLVSYQRVLSTVEKLTYTQDLYAQTRGAMATDVILLYKALGGGWQGSDKHSYLSKEHKEAFKKRGVDWGEYLDE